MSTFTFMITLPPFSHAKVTTQLPGNSASCKGD